MTRISMDPVGAAAGAATDSTRVRITNAIRTTLIEGGLRRRDLIVRPRVRQLKSFQLFCQETCQEIVGNSSALKRASCRYPVPHVATSSARRCLRVRCGDRLR